MLTYIPLLIDMQLTDKCTEELPPLSQLGFQTKVAQGSPKDAATCREVSAEVMGTPIFSFMAPWTRSSLDSGPASLASSIPRLGKEEGGPHLLSWPAFIHVPWFLLAGARKSCTAKAPHDSLGGSQK